MCPMASASVRACVRGSENCWQLSAEKPRKTEKEAQGQRRRRRTARRSTGGRERQPRTGTRASAERGEKTNNRSRG